MEGSYKKYKSVECIMSGVHDFSCYLKRGFGRSTWQSAVDIRNGLLDREEAFKLVNKFDKEKPEVLRYFLKITGLKEKEFYQILKKQRHTKIKRNKLKISKKKRKHPFVLEPFYEQLIKKHLNKK